MLPALPVLRYDETAATEPPPGADPIDLPIAGSGPFESGVAPTDPTVGAVASVDRVSLVFSPFGNVFALSQMGGELGVSIGPAQGVAGTAGVRAWGLHANRVESIGNLKVGYVTPAGGLSGPSIYHTGGRAEGVSGVMFLTVEGREWTVQVFCAYSGGTIVGRARGQIGG